MPPDLDILNMYRTEQTDMNTSTCPATDLPNLEELFASVDAILAKPLYREPVAAEDADMSLDDMSLEDMFKAVDAIMAKPIYQ